jgi:hypothetical protein
LTLSPPERCQLAAKIALLRAFSIPIPNSNSNALAVIRKLIAEFDAQATGTTLRALTHAHVPKFRARLAKKAKAFQKQAASRALVQRLQVLELLLSRQECSECATGNDGPSTSHGLCSSGFGDLFGIVERQASSLYRDLGAPGGLANLPAVTYETWRVSMPPAMVVDFGVVASTRIDGPPGSSVVSLKLNEKHFSDPSLYQLPYIIFHELTCHAFQGVRGGVRENADNACTWTEGWMDAFAFELAVKWAANDTKQSDQWLPEGGKDAAEHMRDYQKARYKPTSQLSEWDAMSLRAAREAFLTLASLLDGKAPGAGGSSHREIWMFSIRLNAHNISLEDRDALGSILSQILYRPKVAPAVSEAIGICREFLYEHDDPERLIAELEVALKH